MVRSIAVIAVDQQQEARVEKRFLSLATEKNKLRGARRFSFTGRKRLPAEQNSSYGHLNHTSVCVKRRLDNPSQNGVNPATMRIRSADPSPVGEENGKRLPNNRLGAKNPAVAERSPPVKLRCPKLPGKRHAAKLHTAPVPRLLRKSPTPIAPGILTLAFSNYLYTILCRFSTRNADLSPDHREKPGKLAQPDDFDPSDPASVPITR